VKVYNSHGKVIYKIFKREISVSEQGWVEQFIRDIHSGSGVPDNEIIYVAWKEALEKLANESIEKLERQHPPEGTPEWYKLEKARLMMKHWQRQDRINEIDEFKKMLDPEEFQLAAERLNWDMEEYAKHHKEPVAPAKKDSEKRREFLEKLFKDKDQIGTDEIKKAAVMAGFCAYDEDKNLVGWEDVRSTAEYYGYMSGTYGVWRNPGRTEKQ
jgi:hypothetical protein